MSLLLDQLNTEDNDCEDEEGENENEDDETAVKEENELEVVSRYDKNKNDNEGKIFRSDKNKKIKLKKHTLWPIKEPHLISIHRYQNRMKH